MESEAGETLAIDFTKYARLETLGDGSLLQRPPSLDPRLEGSSS